MPLRFMIIDDDISIRKIIQNIIRDYELGIVIAECSDGSQALDTVHEFQPDIVFVDLLLPGEDGIEIIKKLRAFCPTISFIMISQASSEPVITQAYQCGVEFYIHKPINVLEIVSVINKVKESRDLRKFMSLIYQTTAPYSNPPPTVDSDTTQQKRIYKVFSDLGIIGEVGAKDIFQMTQLIQPAKGELSSVTYQLYEVYHQLSLKINQDAKTIEQRVRRAIAKALQNVANLGVDDYYNEKFQAYSSALFDFKEVRLEIDYINGKSQYRGKINVRKFIEGLIFIASEQ
jgi:two-component system, response regulator YcbB